MSSGILTIALSSLISSKLISGVKALSTYLKKFGADIHVYGKGRCPTDYPYLKCHPSCKLTSPSQYCCSKCKKPGHFCKSYSDYFCRSCYKWGPGHTQQNHPIKKAKNEEQEQWGKLWEGWGMKIRWGVMLQTLFFLYTHSNLQTLTYYTIS